jgi:hypothetical protein
MSYGKQISQADRKERKLYPQRETHPRKRAHQPRTHLELAICIHLWGYDPAGVPDEIRAMMKTARAMMQPAEFEEWVTVLELSRSEYPVFANNLSNRLTELDYQDEQDMYSDLRNGG